MLLSDLAGATSKRGGLTAAAAVYSVGAVIAA
jgi:hypothetical protein